MEWVAKSNKDHWPESEGWYRVLIPGDSETDGPHVYYDYPDYETWAYWQPADPDELEDFAGGWKGGFQCEHDEESESVAMWCGPIVFPKRPE